MKLLGAILFAKLANPRKTSSALKRDARFIVELVTELVLLIHSILNTVIRCLKILKKYICQPKTVESSKVDTKKIINLADYRLKKAE